MMILYYFYNYYVFISNIYISFVENTKKRQYNIINSI